MRYIFFIVLLSFLIAPLASAVSWWPLVPCGLNQQPAGVQPDQDGKIHDYTQPCNKCELLHLLDNLIDFVFFGVAPILGTFFIVWAGARIITAGGFPEQLSAGKRMFWQTITAWIVLSLAWLGTNTLIRSLAGDSNIATKWTEYKCETVLPTPYIMPSVTPTASGAPTACQQQFGVSASDGCTGSSCVNISSYTDSHGCESAGGQCMVSQGTAQRVQQFIVALNAAGGGGCGLRISSTIQGPGGPSISSCHAPGNAKSGTCVDFNINRASECVAAFYSAARDSGGVVSFLDEYVPACRPPSATGGNIHVNF